MLYQSGGRFTVRGYEQRDAGGPAAFFRPVRQVTVSEYTTAQVT